MQSLGTETRGDELIGHRSALRTVLEQIRLVAKTDSTVLILGETGTGKESIARRIHSMSDRAGRASGGGRHGGHSQRIRFRWVPGAALSAGYCRVIRPGAVTTPTQPTVHIDIRVRISAQMSRLWLAG